MESTLRDIAPAGLVVIETLRYTPKDGFARLGLHIDRAEKTCRILGFPFDRAEVLFALGSSVDALPARVRLAVGAKGEPIVTTAELAPSPQVWQVGIGVETLRSDDPWLTVKTSQRALYDGARAGLGVELDEMIFCNERGEICEGTITNVFVKQEGVLLTPPLSSGVLPGVLRQELIETGQAREAVLTPQDMKSAQVFVGNSLRGLIAARIV